MPKDEISAHSISNLGQAHLAQAQVLRELFQRLARTSGRPRTFIDCIRTTRMTRRRKLTMVTALNRCKAFAFNGVCFGNYYRCFYQSLYIINGWLNNKFLESVNQKFSGDNFFQNFNQSSKTCRMSTESSCRCARGNQNPTLLTPATLLIENKPETKHIIVIRRTC